VAAALQYAHVEAHMVHRDIKPENMMLDRWGKVKVVDFGLARVAGSGRADRGINRGARLIRKVLDSAK